ncbi:MAG: hypothetical protein ACP5VS_13035 [Desulfomonilaceae bacterium]
MKSKSASERQGVTASFSPTESNRFDKRVVRFMITDANIGQLKRQIELHYPDVAIVRLPSQKVHLVNDLYSSFPEVFFGDCLVEYSMDFDQFAVSANLNDSALSVVTADETNLDELSRLVSESFSDYKNHYRHNPVLNEFDLIPIYQEWVKSSVISSDKTCLLFFSAEALCGFFTAEKIGSVYKGLLSGVAPQYRGAGIFRGIIRAVKSIFFEDGATQIVTSVLLENRPVHKVLLSEGFTISNSLYTIHLNLRTSHTLPPSRRWGKTFKSLTPTPTRRRSRFAGLTDNA